VRLEGPTEQAVRDAAKLMQVQVSTVKQRADSWHLYGSRTV
jgi:hypothetical protein